MLVPSKLVSPKIDAAALADYMGASPRRRQRILLDQRASEGHLPYYRAADETICGYLLGIPKQERVIRAKIQVLSTLHAMAPDRAAKIRNNIAALEAFVDHPHREFLDDLETFPGPRRAALRIAGVEIAVCPEIIAVDADTNSFGFIKLRFSTRPMSPSAADYWTTILLAYAQSCAAQFHGALNLDLTCVVDVFEGTMIRANEARPGRSDILRAACTEIAANWPLLYERGKGIPTARRRTC